MAGAGNDTLFQRKVLTVSDTRKRLSPRKPDWLRIRLPEGKSYGPLRDMLRERNLHTVCEEARCPNLGKCWGGGTATFMIMGDICTRGCRFCAVKTRKIGQALDPKEPHKIAESVQMMGLDYVVITSVDRDDLPDEGAAHFAQTIRTVFAEVEGIRVEVLTPDFRGNRPLVEIVAKAEPTVFAHNVETVRRLTPKVRDPRCGYEQSLEVLRWAKAAAPGTVTKTSLMLGLGETKEELMQAMDDIREAGVEILTLGQYLQPTTKHLPVVEYVHPDDFEALAEEGRARGFAFVPSGPMVRSSYRAGELFTAHFQPKPLKVD